MFHKIHPLLRGCLKISKLYYTQPPCPPILGSSELKVPQNWAATSVGGFPDLRKVARI
jgi:hypothetical protein